MKTPAWHLVRIELAAAIVAIGAAAWYLTVPPPDTMGGPIPRPIDQPLVWVGVAGVLLGLIWMIRIYRADPEGHRSWWRFDRA